MLHIILNSCNKFKSETFFEADKTETKIIINSKNPIFSKNFKADFFKPNPSPYTRSYVDVTHLGCEVHGRSARRVPADTGTTRPRSSSAADTGRWG